MKLKAGIESWGHWLAAILLFDGVLMGYLTVTQKSMVYFAFFLIFTLLCIVILPVYLSTFYLIEDTDLVIHSGFLVKKRIPYTVITHALKVRNAKLASCLSLERIELRYWEKGEHKTLWIAPEDRDFFQRMMVLKNPLIDISDNQPKAYDMLELLKHPELLQPKKPSVEHLKKEKDS
jgi:hypothetical protein